MFRRKDKEFVLDMHQACRRILNYIENISFQEFLKSEEKQDAVTRNIEILGEAVKNITKEFKEKYPEIEWSLIAKARDKLIHFYFGVDLEIVWKIATKDVPHLKQRLEEIIEKEGWQNET